MNLDDFDFIDFGSSKGGGIEFAKARFGGVRGLGIDLDPKKVKGMKDSGYDCLRDDITALGLSSKSVRFVMMGHILEHLPDLESVQEAVAEAARVARDFLFIEGPFFDADHRLEKLGFRFFWSKWTGHRCHLTTSQLRDVLLHLQLPDHCMFVRQPVVDSSDPSIHPLGSPVNSLEYDPQIHPPKPHCTFSPPVFKEMVCYVKLRPMPDENWKQIISARRRCQPLDIAVPDRQEFDS